MVYLAELSVYVTARFKVVRIYVRNVPCVGPYTDKSA